jgi:hypothetical protein
LKGEKTRHRNGQFRAFQKEVVQELSRVIIRGGHLAVSWCRRPCSTDRQGARLSSVPSRSVDSIEKLLLTHACCIRVSHAPVNPMPEVSLIQGMPNSLLVRHFPTLAVQASAVRLRWRAASIAGEINPNFSVDHSLSPIKSRSGERVSECLELPVQVLSIDRILKQ